MTLSFAARLGAGALVALALTGPAACDRCRPVGGVPAGTWAIDPATIPAELETDAMTVTIAGDVVTFRYVDPHGPQVVVYHIEDRDPP